jgi:hypothetical protein
LHRRELGIVHQAVDLGSAFRLGIELDLVCDVAHVDK